ncbi:phosphatase PAP2 family protein [Thiotrichales bacterium 19S11-10]|nr:phosphatase PAP2 family protein [Thiotrichales bacterium 19S11-10]
MAKVQMPLKSSLIFLILLIIFYLFSFYFFDQSIAYFINKNISDNTPLFHISAFLSHIFDPNTWAIIMCLLFSSSLLCYIKKQPFDKFKSQLLVALSLFIALSVGTVTKFILARYRPELLFSDHLYGFHYFSFKKVFNSSPSGHSLSAFAGFISVALAFNKKWLFAIATILSIMISIARIIVSKHFLSDIVFGAYIGVFSVLWAQWLIYFLYYRFDTKTD